MAKYKLVFEDIQQDGKDGFAAHLEDEDGNQLEELELDYDEVTPALMAAIQMFEELRFAADQIKDEDDNVIGGIDFENKSSTKH